MFRNNHGIAFKAQCRLPREIKKPSDDGFIFRTCTKHTFKRGDFFRANPPVGFGHFCAQRNERGNNARLINIPRLPALITATRRTKKTRTRAPYALPQAHENPLPRLRLKGNDWVIFIAGL